MTTADAINLIRKGVNTARPQNWADLGCGSGTFTEALSTLLPAHSQVTPVDKQIQKLPNFIKADFEKDELDLSGLDGILMANSLHYVRDKQTLVKKLEHYFAVGPNFLIIEYDTSRSNHWVLYPILDQLNALFNNLGHNAITKLAERPSIYNRANIYAAIIQKIQTKKNS